MSAHALPPARKPFGEALADLLRETDYVMGGGNVSFHGFAKAELTVSGETLRKAVEGQRPPSPELIEEVARALRVTPEHFVEYRLHEERGAFDPRTVGFDVALRNLEEWQQARAGRAPAGKRTARRPRGTRR